MVSSRGRTSTTVRCVAPADSRRWKYRVWDNFVLHGWLYYGLWGATPRSPGFSSECPSPRWAAIQGYEPLLPRDAVYVILSPFQNALFQGGVASMQMSYRPLHLDTPF